MIRFLTAMAAGVIALCSPVIAFADMAELPVVKLQSLDKASARTMTFEARVGSTVKFGPLYIKVQACRKAQPTDQPESAAFLQIWEVTPRAESVWVYSGWMFASSPALSPMDHPIYDVWVLDCLERKSDEPVPEQKPAETPGDGEVTGDAAEPPSDNPQDSIRVTMPDGEGPRVEGPGLDAPPAVPEPVVTIPDDQTPLAPR